MVQVEYPDAAVELQYLGQLVGDDAVEYTFLEDAFAVELAPAVVELLAGSGVVMAGLGILATVASVKDDGELWIDIHGRWD